MADPVAVTQIRPSTSTTSISNVLMGDQTLGTQNSIDNGINPNSGVMRFPIDLESYDYWLSFSFYQYRRPTFAGNPVLADQGTIKLPLPANLQDALGVTYNQQDLDLAVGAGLNALSKNGAFDTVGSGVASAIESAGAAVGSGLVGGLRNLGPNITAGAGQLLGVALNPWTTIMFKGPQYRKYAMTWLLTPSNEAESQAIYNMINTFKFNMLPDTSGAIGGTLLTYPNICQISARNGKSNYWNYVFKPAVIESFNVNYAGAGQPSFFGTTKAPTAIEIRIGFQEIEFFLQRDYGTPNNAGMPVINRLSGEGGNALAVAALGTGVAAAAWAGRRLGRR